MDHIRQALERARARTGPSEQHGDAARALVDGGRAERGELVREISLDVRRLESNRIIAYDDTDSRTKSFDMLRTQVLQTMDQKNWRLLGVTSPSPGCGKTVTAINLAFSIARQPERSALLVDLDLRKPQLSSYLGANCRTGLINMLEGRSNLLTSTIVVNAESCRVTVLPVENSVSDSSVWMTSRAMSDALNEIKSHFRSHYVIVDLPPVLTSDDVIAILPQLDCVLLVAAVGKSTAAEVNEASKLLPPGAVVRLVLNKVPQSDRRYSYY